MHDDKTRIVFAGGGTGGHLFPALCVADELRRRRPAAEIRFIGARAGLERRLVPQAGYELRLLRLSGIKGRSWSARLGAVVEAAWAVVRCVGWMVSARPGLVIGVGGFASGPAAAAALLLRVRTMVMEQNHFPGATNRFLSRWVDTVCLPSEEARRRLGGIGIVTGNPVRKEFHRVGERPAAAEFSLLAFGGSRGAASINRAMTGALSQLAELDPVPRIVHQTGAADEEQVREAYRHYPEGRWEVQPFLDDMPVRLAAADLVVCRAGASTLAELAAAGRPAILVPYPFAADDHQRHNAVAVEQAGAALVLADDALDGASLAARVCELAPDRPRLRAMGAAARGLSIADATSRIADAAEALLRGGGADVS